MAPNDGAEERPDPSLGDADDDALAVDGVAASLVADGVQFGADDAALLRAVAAEGSVSGAASALGRSRARALARLEDLERAFGDLVERRRGGADGGGSRLTARAETVLARYDRLGAALSGTAGAAESVLEGTVREVTGELAVVETAAGPVRALLAGPSESTSSADEPVQVSLRADAVTLHAPADPPADEATSARNLFAGRVTDLNRGEAVAEVSVDVGATAPLCALVTTESVDRLALTPGTEVVVSFKATATRATPARTDGRSAPSE